MKTNLHEEAVKLATSIINRRSFFKTAGATGLGLAGAALVGGKLGVMDGVPGMTALGVKPAGVEAAGVTDTDILNFALNLEYLEAEFYTVGVTGKRIADYGIGENGTGTYGPTMGGKMVNFSGLANGAANVFNILAEITKDEMTHVKILRDALGSAAIAKPAINLDALGSGFANYQQFLAMARAFEDVGVSAYGGAAPLIMNKTYLSGAVRVGLAEAYHAGNIRLLVADLNIPTGPVDSQDILPPPTGSQYFTLDSNAMAIVRTPSEVLNIAYQGGTCSGGFFPNGVNGAIRCR